MNICRTNVEIWIESVWFKELPLVHKRWVDLACFTGLMETQPI